jgi:hypothetical protein
MRGSSGASAGAAAAGTDGVGADGGAVAAGAGEGAGAVGTALPTPGLAWVSMGVTMSAGYAAMTLRPAVVTFAAVAVVAAATLLGAGSGAEALDAGVAPEAVVAGGPLEAVAGGGAAERAAAAFALASAFRLAISSRFRCCCNRTAGSTLAGRACETGPGPADGT